ncbi:MAG: hypothetical protein Q9163_004407 [Psora crenata]
MEVIHASPTDSQYILLSTFQSQTPESFDSGPPVLHHHSPSATLKIYASELDVSPALSTLASGAHRHRVSEGGTVNGDTRHEEGEEEKEDQVDHGNEEEIIEVEIAGIDIWVTSEYVGTRLVYIRQSIILRLPCPLTLCPGENLPKNLKRRFILFSPSRQTGLSIPYPTITLHAIQRSGGTASLFLQLLTAPVPVYDDHDPDSTVSLTIVPSNTAANVPANEPREAGDPPEVSEVEKLYTALSACANLHPDYSYNSGSERSDASPPRGPSIQFEGEGDLSGVFALGNNGMSGQEGLPPPMPGSGGWITAENVGELFDDAGNFRGRDGGVDGHGLGAGAGNVRAREDGGSVDGGGDDDGVRVGEDTKWRRTE